jgi:hypothetical protein
MPAGAGFRKGTRDKFKRAFRGKGYINLSTYLTTYKLGDFVDIKVNGAVHKVSWKETGDGERQKEHYGSGRQQPTRSSLSCWLCCRWQSSDSCG